MEARWKVETRNGGPHLENRVSGIQRPGHEFRGECCVLSRRSSRFRSSMTYVQYRCRSLTYCLGQRANCFCFPILAERPKRLESSSSQLAAEVSPISMT